MAFFRASSFPLIVFLSAWLISVTAAGHNHHEPHPDREQQANVSSTNISLAVAPYHRNVSPGVAWVVPKSPYDLGARDVHCECFNPNGM